MDPCSVGIQVALALRYGDQDGIKGQRGARMICGYEIHIEALSGGNKAA